MSSGPLWDQLQEANRKVREQWAKFDLAVARGYAGAPLVQMNRKLVRLEQERDEIEEKLRNYD